MRNGYTNLNELDFCRLPHNGLVKRTARLWLGCIIKIILSRLIIGLNVWMKMGSVEITLNGLAKVVQISLTSTCIRLSWKTSFAMCVRRLFKTSAFHTQRWCLAIDLRIVRLSLNLTYRKKINWWWLVLVMCSRCGPSSCCCLVTCFQCPTGDGGERTNWLDRQANEVVVKQTEKMRQIANFNCSRPHPDNSNTCWPTEAARKASTLFFRTIFPITTGHSFQPSWPFIWDFFLLSFLLKVFFSSAWKGDFLIKIDRHSIENKAQSTANDRICNSDQLAGQDGDRFRLIS